MASSFHEPRSTQPQIATEDPTWQIEIALVESAVQRLFDAKRSVLADDPHHEQVLWARYIDRLRVIKRKLDAVCM
jgi:hypothetical protein